jgi:hypothetical protein
MVKKEKRTNNNLQITTQKTKDRATRIQLWIEVISKIFTVISLEVSLIGDENRSTRRKLPTCPKSQEFTPIFS